MKKILITGASEGIGLEIAKILAAKGNEITLVARGKEKLEAALNSLPGKGHQVIQADLCKKDQVDALREKINQEKYDVLINNAGAGMYGRFTEMALSDQVNMMNLNITALTALSYFYLRQAKKGDALINVASNLGNTSFAGAAVYAATKAYVINFSEALWWENKKRGVYVVGVCPGATYTNFHNTAGGEKEDFPKAVIQTPQQVAEELVRALEKRRKPKVITGWMNRFMVTLHKFMSRRMVVNMMAGFGPLKNA